MRTILDAGAQDYLRARLDELIKEAKERRVSTHATLEHLLHALRVAVEPPKSGDAA